MLKRSVQNLWVSIAAGALLGGLGCGSGDGRSPADAGTPDAQVDPRFTVLPTPTALSGPWMITPGPDGNLWFTERGDGTSDVHKIGRVTLAGEITEFDLPAGSQPWGITSGPDGALWFTDFTAEMVGRITTDGEVSEFPLAMPGAPISIVAGPDGNLWFTVTTTTDTASPMGNIERITPTGEVTLFPLSTQPEEIAVGPDGNLWFVAWYHTAIDTMTPAGAVSEFQLKPGSFPHGLVAGPDRNMWIAEATGTGRLSTSGVETFFALPDDGRTPFGRANEFGQITAGADGTLWLVDDTARELARVSVDGTMTETPVPEGSVPVGIAVASDGSVWTTDDINHTIVRFRP